MDVDKDGGVAEGVRNANMVEPSLGCVGVGGVGVGELSSRCMGVVVGHVGVALDDHYHRSINVWPIFRQNERVGIRGGKIRSQIRPHRPIGSSAELRAPPGSTWRSIDSCQIPPL